MAAAARTRGTPTAGRVAALTALACGVVLLAVRSGGGGATVQDRRPLAGLDVPATATAAGGGGSAATAAAGEGAIPRSHLEAVQEELLQDDAAAQPGRAQADAARAAQPLGAAAARKSGAAPRARGASAAAGGARGSGGADAGAAARAARQGVTDASRPHAAHTAAPAANTEPTAAPLGAPSPSSSERGPAGALETSGIFPTFLTLGTSKGGSTFLFDCLAGALHPEVVCGTDDPRQWVSGACAGKTLALPALRIRLLSRDNRTIAHVHQIKENYVLTRAMYHGPAGVESRVAYYRGPRLPLAYWSRANAGNDRGGRVPNQAGAIEIADQLLRSCAAHAGTGADGSGCPVVARRGEVHKWRTMDARVGEACGFRPPMEGKFEPAREMAISARCVRDKAARKLGNYYLADVRAYPPPLSGVDGATVVGMDACPYYLAESTAPKLLRDMAPSKEAIRFVVLVRDPVARAYSEWSMAQSWTGLFHRGHSFEKAVSQQVGMLNNCLKNAGGAARFVSGHVSLSAFRRLYGQCVRNDYYHYVSNSLYGLHLRNWLALWPPQQFLVLETEAMKRMLAPQLLSLVGEHAGLSVELDRLPPKRAQKCEARAFGGGPLPNHKSKGVPLEPGVAERLQDAFFHGAAPVLNMVLPPQLWRPDEQRPAPPAGRNGTSPPSVARARDAAAREDAAAARAHACSLVRCGPARPPPEPAPAGAATANSLRRRGRRRQRRRGMLQA